MKKSFLFVIFIFTNICLFAQYTGGGGDGYAHQFLQNKLPVGADVVITLNENSSYTFSENDFSFSDADGYFSGIQLIGMESNGDLEYQNQNVLADQFIEDVSRLVFKTLTNQYGNPYAIIQFKVADNEGGLSTDTYTITVNVIANPLSTNIHLPVNEDDTITLSASNFNFTFGQNRNFSSVRIAFLPKGGILKYAGNTAQTAVDYFSLDSFVYIPFPDSNGISYDNFSYYVYDDKGFRSDSAYFVYFDVQAMPDAPLSADTSVVLYEDENFVFSAARFAFSDVDGDIFAGLFWQTLPSAGTLIYSGDTLQQGDTCKNLALLEYIPPENAYGTPFTSAYFKVNDSQNQLSNSVYQLKFNILPVADAPFSSDTAININEDENYTFSAWDFPFADVDNDLFGGVYLNSVPTKGILKYDGNPVSNPQEISNPEMLTFLPENNVFGENYVQFSFKVKDATGLYSSLHNLTINVLPVNDLPVAQSFSKNIFEDQPYYFNAKDMKYSDIEGDTLTGIYFDALPSRGTLYFGTKPVQEQKVYSPVDSVYFISNLNEYGSSYATISFKVVDAEQGMSENSYQVTFHVDNSPDAPISADFSAVFYEDRLQNFAQLDIPFMDADKNVFKGVILTQLPQRGQLLYDKQAAAINTEYDDLSLLTYQAEKDAFGNAFDSLKWKVVDNTGLASESDYWVIFDVYPVNDPPYALNLSSNHIAEDKPLGSTVGYFTAYDIDSEIFTYKLSNSTGLSDADNKHFAISGNALITQINLDYESQYLYSIYVSAFDDDNDSISKSFLIYVDDVYENAIAQHENRFRIYPNPVIHSLNFETSDLLINEYEIFALNGKVIIPKSRLLNNRIELTQIPTGTYLLVLYSNKQLFRKIFVKQ